MRHQQQNPWKLWREEERSRLKFNKDLARIRAEIEELEENMFWSLVQQYSQDKGFLRALSRFSGHTPYGWEVACGPDGRIANLTKLLGWTKLQRLIHEVKRSKWI